jgi:hypothetical protein
MITCKSRWKISKRNYRINTYRKRFNRRSCEWQKSNKVNTTEENVADALVIVENENQKSSYSH